MKFRTDFVTNSSSYCTAEVVIENPVLLEILQKYKDMGLFGKNDPIFGIGDYKVYGYSGPYEFHGDSHRPKTPAFYLYNDDSDDDLRHLGITDETTPKSLEEVLEKIIQILDFSDMWLNKEIRDDLVQELNSRQVEILVSYSSVNWSSELEWDDGDAEASFVFDPIDGGKFKSKNSEHLAFGEEDEDETSED